MAPSLPTMLAGTPMSRISMAMFWGLSGEVNPGWRLRLYTRNATSQDR